MIPTSVGIFYLGEVCSSIFRRSAKGGHALRVFKKTGAVETAPGKV